MSTTSKGFNKASDYAKSRFNRWGTEIEKAQTDSTSKTTNHIEFDNKVEEDTQNSSSSKRYYFDKSKEQKSLPGNVTMIGKILASIAKFFSKVTTWITAKLFGSVFGNKKSRFWPHKKIKEFKDRFMSKIAIFIGGILGVIITFKGIKYYVKNRTLRQKDQEIARLKNEIKEMREELDKELKDYRKEVRSLK